MDFGPFLLLALMEGLVTAAVVLFLHRAQPDLLARSATRAPLRGVRLKPVLVGLALAALVTGGALSLLASGNADGLEWSIAKVTGADYGVKAGSATHDAAGGAQERTAVLPDYGFKADAQADGRAVVGTSVAGVAGAVIVLAVAVVLGLALRRRSAARARANARAPS